MTNKQYLILDSILCKAIKQWNQEYGKWQPKFDDHEYNYYFVWNISDGVNIKWDCTHKTQRLNRYFHISTTMQAEQFTLEVIKAFIKAGYTKLDLEELLKA